MADRTIVEWRGVSYYLDDSETLYRIEYNGDEQSKPNEIIIPHKFPSGETIVYSAP